MFPYVAVVKQMFFPGLCLKSRAESEHIFNTGTLHGSTTWQQHAHLSAIQTHAINSILAL